MRDLHEKYIIILTDLIKQDIMDRNTLLNRINYIRNDSRHHISDDLLDDYFDELIISKLYEAFSFFFIVNPLDFS